MKTAALLVAALALSGSQAGKPSGLASEGYPFRGPNRDGHSPDTGLLKQWPAGGPPLAWKAGGLGIGFSSVSLFGSRLFTLGESNGAISIFALNAADGKPLWSSKVADLPADDRQSKRERNHPGPRCTPTTDGSLVYAIGQYGDLVCFEVETGKEKWRKHLEKDFGGKMMSGWMYSESPLLDGDLLVCTPGGSKGTVLALKKESGEPVWQSRELTDPSAYASLLPVEIGGVRQYLVLTERTVAGIAAKDGKVLWRANRAGQTAVVATPVYRDGLVFVTSSYDIGCCNAFRITADGGVFKAEEVYTNKSMKNHHGGVVLVGDHVYGFDANTSLKCLEFKTGKEVWADRSVGKGSVAYADGHLVVRSERGPVALVEATPAGYREKSRFDQPDRSKRQAWPYPVIFGGKLYLRDQEILLCYDVKAK